MIPSYSMQIARVQHVLNRVSQANRDKHRHIPRLNEKVPVTSKVAYIACGTEEAVGIVCAYGGITHVAATGHIGLGQDVLRQLERLARNDGLNKVVVSVFDTGTLVNWYWQQGYRVTNIVPFDPAYDIRIEGTPDVYYMEKKL